MSTYLSGFSVHGISQVRILEWVAMPSSRVPSQPRDRTQIFHIAGRFFTFWVTREALLCTKYHAKRFRYIFHLNCKRIGYYSSGHRNGKGQFSFQTQRKVITKNAQTTAQLHSSHASKVMLKILQARLQQYVNHELQDVQAGFRKGRATRDQIANIHEKFFKRWEYQTTWPASWGTCIQVRKHQLELDMEQQTGSKQEKEYVKAVYCHPVYLTYMQSTSREMPGWLKHKLESRLLGEISVTSDMHPYGRKWRRNKVPLDESERGELNSWLKAQHSEN